MVPQSQKRKPRNSSRVNLIFSLVFHGVIAIVLAYFAAREGLLGKQLKKIAVEMVKEKPPEKPKEPDKPKPEPPKVEPPKVAVAPRIETPAETLRPPPPVTAPVTAAPPPVAPAAVDVPSFAFDGGKTVETASDPVQLYRGLVEYSFRSRWSRPEDEDDHNFVAEVEVAVDRTGRISDPVWKKNSGDKRWDSSVREAIERTPSLNRPPPANFPSRIVVRFDVVASEALVP